jgi:hypothetical protein
MTVQDTQPPVPARPLPLLAIAKESFDLLFANLGAFVAAMAVPLVIELLAVWAFWTTYGPEMVRLSMDGGGSFGAPGIFFLRMFGLLLVLMIAYALFAVAWHRFALLGAGDRPRVLPAVQGRHMRFLLLTYGVGLLIGLIAMAALVPLGALRVNSQILLVLVSFGLILIFTRWQLAFPAIAVDRPLGLGGAWRASRGQTLRLFWLFLLVVVPPAAVRWLIDRTFQQDMGAFIMTGTISLPAAAGLAISAVMGYVMLAMLVGAISGAYRRLVLQQTS